MHTCMHMLHMHMMSCTCMFLYFTDTIQIFTDPVGPSS